MTNKEQVELVEVMGFIRNGDRGATSRLWDLLFPQIRVWAKSQLHMCSLAFEDEEDVAIFVLRAFIMKLEAGGLAYETDECGVWRLLATTTRRRSRDVNRAVSRHRARTERYHAARATQASFVDEAIARDSLAVTYQAIKPQTAEIARLRLAGYTLEEIGNHCKLSRKTVTRKLAVSREHAAKHFDGEI